MTEDRKTTIGTEFPVRLRRSGKRLARATGAGILMVLASAFLFWDTRTDYRIAGFVGLVFFTPAMILSATQWIWRPTLTLDSRGVRQKAPFASKRLQWSEVGHFRLVGSGAGSTIAFERFVSLRDRNSLSGYDRGAKSSPRLAAGWNMADDAVVALLNNARAQWAGPPPESTSENVAVPIGAPGHRLAWLTGLLLAVLVGVFIVEHREAVTPPGDGYAPSLGTLVAIGGLRWTLVEAGQWFRLLTAPLLHANVVHLLFNSLALGLAGAALERYVGRAWMFCIFALGAVAGSVMSMILAESGTVAVGASGAILAVLVALYVVSFRLPPGKTKSRLQTRTLAVTVPALIPTSHTAGALMVDYGAHLGGGLLGLAIGLVLLLTWPARAPLPGFRRMALALSGVFVLAFAAAGYEAWRTYHRMAPRIAMMIPQEIIPHDTADIVTHGESLAKAYPNDPRALSFSAIALLQRHDLAGAEQDLRTSLAMAEAEPVIDPPTLVNNLRATLAITLFSQGRRNDAIAFALAACGGTGRNAAAPVLVKALISADLCPPSRDLPGR